MHHECLSCRPTRLDYRARDWLIVAFLRTSDDINVVSTIPLSSKTSIIGQMMVKFDYLWLGGIWIEEREKKNSSLKPDVMISWATGSPRDSQEKVDLSLINEVMRDYLCLCVSEGIGVGILASMVAPATRETSVWTPSTWKKYSVIIIAPSLTRLAGGTLVITMGPTSITLNPTPPGSGNCVTPTSTSICGNSFKF